jgi:hypothetical protein
MPDVKISALPAASSVAAGDVYPIVQGGITKRATGTQLKSGLSLDNVNNTSDANKPISTATQTALDGKSATGHTHTASDITNFNTAADARVTLGIAPVDITSITYDTNDPPRVTGYVRAGTTYVITYPSSTQITISVGGSPIINITLNGVGNVTSVDVI